MVNWTGKLIWPKNKLLAVYSLFGFAGLFLAWVSPPVCMANSCADLWVRINPGDRESSAKIPLVKLHPEGAVRQYS